MTNKDIENRLQNAVAAVTPDILDSILSDCKTQKGKVIAMTKTTKTNKTQRILAIAAAFVILAAGAFGIYTYRMNNMVTSTVSLDVNPSIEIKVNNNERVIEVNPLNEDGKKVIGNMDFDGNDIDVTVNALIGSMLSNGYLNDIRNSILLTVDNDDAKKGAELQKRLAKEINELLQTDIFTGAVLSQTVSSDNELQKLADKHEITLGKAKLIDGIIKKNPLHTFEELAPLSINDLNLLSKSEMKKPENVETIGTASDKEYIGEEIAKNKAFADAGVKEADVTEYEVDMDFDKGVMVYEIDFATKGFEYDYEINAVTGEIIKDRVEADHDDDDDDYKVDTKPDNKVENDKTENNTAANNNAKDIGVNKAKSIAFAHAKVAAGNARNVEIDIDDDHGIKVYEVDFEAGDYEYTYDINAATGAIITVDKEWDDDNHKVNKKPTDPPATTKAPVATKAPATTAAKGYISEAKAKVVALNHAGVTATQIKDYDIERDRENGIIVYEVDFDAEGYEYSYTINATSGKVVHYEKERDDDYRPAKTTTKATTKAPTTKATTKAAEYITKDKAKSIALNRAGVSASEIKGYEIEFDRDDGRATYEIEFRVGNYEYSVEINASTGAVIDYEKDYDD